MVLSPHEPWYVPACTSVVAIVSKYLVRTRIGQRLQPGRAWRSSLTFYVFDTGQSWWGALPEVPPLALAALLLTGIFIADRVNKMPLVLAFLGVYFGLFTITAFAGEPVARRRGLSHAGRPGGAVLRLLHPHRSADLAGAVSRPDRLRG